MCFAYLDSSWCENVIAKTPFVTAGIIMDDILSSCICIPSECLAAGPVWY